MKKKQHPFSKEKHGENLLLMEDIPNNHRLDGVKTL